MKNFQMRRFLRLLRWDLCNYRKQYFSTFGGMTLAFLATQISMFKGKVRVPEDSLCLEIAGIQGLVCFLIFVVTLSAVFLPLKTKLQRINYLILPASNVEKLLSRLVVFPLIAVCLSMVALLLADGLRMLLFVSAEEHYGPVFPYVITLMAEGVGEILEMFTIPRHGGVHGAWVALLVISFFTFIFSSYVLGSALFRRRAFLKTSISLIVAMIAAGFLSDFAQWLLGIKIDSASMGVRAVYIPESFVQSVVMVFALLTVFNLWKSCRHFTQIQVISRRLFKK